ncbi:MAG: competence/damage-inducible protein A [Sandaracinaceae bacterium]|nr:competence/damage-inducible protein A [Sandaracinaceae bacterium]
MAAAVLSIGTELTRGELANTNARWLGERLTSLGLDVRQILTVPDDPDVLVSAVTRLAADTSTVVATGGLGPTTDDLTAAAVARALGVPLVRHEPSIEAIKRRFATLGRDPSPSNFKQADLPQGADVLPNPVGTAPGFAVQLGACRFFFLPGVPAEMQRLYDDHVQPVLQARAERNRYQLRLKTFGLPESQVGERLAGLEERHPGLVIGYRAHFPEVEVKLLVQAANGGEAEELTHKIAVEARERLGDAVFAEGDDTYPEVLGRLLRDRGMTIALAESCTGGMLGSLITAVPGSSEYLLFDAVTYSNAAKTSVLGVSGEILRAYGAVSAECAAAMADGARRVADSDLAISITGVAGPGGGSEEKPVGTVWFGIARRARETQAVKHTLSWGDRERIRQAACFVAMRMLSTAAREP